MAPRLLDLFCGAGGCSMGYDWAGFEVVGVDIAPQPRYMWEFHQADALEFLDEVISSGEKFDVIHASPPCTGWSKITPYTLRYAYPDFLSPTREKLISWGGVYVIENVPGSPLHNPVRVCGTAFGLGAERGQLRRHRNFESNRVLRGTTCNHDGRSAVWVAGHGRHATNFRDTGLSASESRDAMGIQWMNRAELAQAIPPDYTEWIGGQLYEHLAALVA